jgi:hypothetical protein
MAGSCIFCGSKADSREHAIPKWIGKRFNMRLKELRPVYMLHVEPRRQPVIFGSHRERIFCKGCNAHFKHLEDQAIPVVEWIARGRSIKLGPHEQDVLARWGAKTGYALIAAETEMRDLVPMEHTLILREEGQVHPLTWVGYASWLGRTFKFGGGQSLKTPEERTVRAYGAILTWANLALKVFGVYEPVPKHELFYDTNALKQVSPPLDRDISWPLFPAAGDRNIQTMAELPPLTPTE